jgi:hypothetical protein
MHERARFSLPTASEMAQLWKANRRQLSNDLQHARLCPRHAFDHADFVAVDQLTQRLRNYVRADLTPQRGLS